MKKYKFVNKDRDYVWLTIEDEDYQGALVTLGFIVSSPRDWHCENSD